MKKLFFVGILMLLLVFGISAASAMSGENMEKVVNYCLEKGQDLPQESGLAKYLEKKEIISPDVEWRLYLVVHFAVLPGYLVIYRVECLNELWKFSADGGYTMHQTFVGESGRIDGKVDNAWTLVHERGKEGSLHISEPVKLDKDVAQKIYDGYIVEFLMAIGKVEI